MSKINSIICLDFETGGLNPAKNPATQVAYQAFDLDTYKPTLEFSTYIQPYDDLKLEDEAMKYTGITYQQLASGIDSKAVVKKMCDDFSEANTANTHTKKPILLGHNIGFDIGFLCYLFNKHKVDLGKYLNCNKNYLGIEIPTFIDTLSMAKQKWANDIKMTKFNLTACCQKAGVEITDAHSALNDVKATKELFFYFTNILRSGTQTIEEATKHTRVRNHFQF